jgi:hypothetical protein
VRICADENVSSRLVEIVNDLSSGPPRLEHVSEIDALGVEDCIWVRAFAQQGGEAVITADAKMSKRQAELLAVGETGLKLVILPTQYQQGGIRFQTAYMLLSWPLIIKLVGEGPRGGFLRLSQITLPRAQAWEKIDVQDTKRRLRKATRPSRQGHS